MSVKQHVNIAYGDTQLLADRLAQLFGDNEYKITIKIGYFELTIPRKLLQEEIDNINDGIRSHYQTLDQGRVA